MRLFQTQDRRKFVLGREQTLSLLTKESKNDSNFKNIKRFSYKYLFNCYISNYI